MKLRKRNRDGSLGPVVNAELRETDIVYDVPTLVYFADLPGLELDGSGGLRGNPEGSVSFDNPITIAEARRWKIIHATDEERLQLIDAGYSLESD
jgi:hypothetical protein